MEKLDSLMHSVKSKLFTKLLWGYVDEVHKYLEDMMQL